MKREEIEKIFLESGINCDNDKADYVDDTFTNVIDVVDNIINARVATTPLSIGDSDVQCEYCNNKGAKPINAYKCDKCGMVFLSER